MSGKGLKSIKVLLLAGIVFFAGVAFLANSYAEDDASDAKKEVVLKVSGMTCAECEGKVKSALEGCDGVIKATADHKTGEAVVEVEAAAEINADALSKAVEKAGFKVEG
mgnify:FL=1